MTPTLHFANLGRYRRIVRRVLWHRRKYAAVCAAIAVFAALNVLRPPPAPTVIVVVASHDLAAGARLSPGDVADLHVPRDLAPSHTPGSVREVIGRTLSSSLSRGSVVTSLNLVGDAWSALDPGRRAVPVRLQDAALADLIRPGQHVRLTAVDPRSPGEAQTIVEDAVVLAIPPRDRGMTAASAGRLVVFDVPATSANLVTSSAVSRYLTVIWGY
jgi:Flp pilus assembly protein CpaB